MRTSIVCETYQMHPRPSPWLAGCNTRSPRLSPKPSSLLLAGHPPINGRQNAAERSGGDAGEFLSIGRDEEIDEQPIWQAVAARTVRIDRVLERDDHVVQRGDAADVECYDFGRSAVSIEEMKSGMRGWRRLCDAECWG